jgi:hypothetical protein
MAKIVEEVIAVKVSYLIKEGEDAADSIGILQDNVIDDISKAVTSAINNSAVLVEVVK